MTLKFSLVQKIGNAIKEVARNKGSTCWYTPHMAAASRAITERIPLVDILLEVRDAREWLKYFERKKCLDFGVNSHNKDNIKEVLYALLPYFLVKLILWKDLQLLNFLQDRVRELPKIDHGDQTITLMLFGIPNVGKSALANSLHQIGRISAAGAIKDCLVGEVELAEYFLSIFNLSDEYKKWVKLSLSGADDCSELERRQKRQYLTDHTEVSFNRKCVITTPFMPLHYMLVPFPLSFVYETALTKLDACMSTTSE
ncbi:hypothetical protein CQW23_29440 [Capsicum baccatum]|uniref:G domain-containing protein n=1 Tax=Capsicum baccatum TaxID=33114 RepID=A0A2G2VJG0_CAPBA|nr:hypothetical protein CQW23_29440 [Capsicum baccatum]